MTKLVSFLNRLSPPSRSKRKISKESNHCSDKEISARVRAALWKVETIRSLDLNSIRITVRYCHVSLSGHVAKDSHKKTIEKIAAQVPGVVAVDNQIIPDHDLVMEIAQALGKDPRTRSYRILVGCFHGWIRLNGEVPSREVLNAVEEVAAQVPNGRGIATLPRLAGCDAHEVRHLIQPIIGDMVYAADGFVGRLTRVIINPKNRLVSHIVVKTVSHADLRPEGSELVVPAKVIEIASKGSVFLEEKKGSFSLHPIFSTDDYPLAPSGWRPPFPYVVRTVRWSHGKAQEVESDKLLSQGNIVDHDHLIDIPLSAEVECTGGAFGRSTYVLINRSTRQMTNIVVRENDKPHTEHLVPLSRVLDSNLEMIHLAGTQDELKHLEPFIEMKLVSRDISHFDPFLYSNLLHPFETSERITYPVESRHIPPGESVIHQKAQVLSQDGPVGRVIDFLVDSETRHITHVVIRGGPFWRRKDIMLPVAVIAYIEENKIYLKIDKRTFNSLLRLPVYETLFRPLPPPGL